MIQQLVQRVAAGVPALAIPGMPANAATATVLMADPLDLVLHMEQVWNAYMPWGIANGQPAGPARLTLANTSAFTPYVPAQNNNNAAPPWEHLGYSYVLENTRAVQIFRRVVRAYRTGESLGVPSMQTQRWLDATEALLFGAANPLSAWLSTSSVRQDSEAVRRNAYWRLFGLDLAFGADDNRPPAYDRADASNGSFVRLFEELLYELWRAIANMNNFAGENQADDDRIFRLAEQLEEILRSRRQVQLLGREELAASTVLGWIELTLSMDTPVVLDLRAEATSASDRLQLIAQRVGMAPHSKSAAFFSMAQELSDFLRVIESGIVADPGLAQILYLPAPAGIGVQTRRVITEWAAATGKDLKLNARPVPIQVRQPPVPANRRIVAPGYAN